MNSWISDFRFHLALFLIAPTVGKFDPENMGVAVGISFLSGLLAEIHLGVYFDPRPCEFTSVK